MCLDLSSDQCASNGHFLYWFVSCCRIWFIRTSSAMLNTAFYYSLLSDCRRPPMKYRPNIVKRCVTKINRVACTQIAYTCSAVVFHFCALCAKRHCRIRRVVRSFAKNRMCADTNAQSRSSFSFFFFTFCSNDIFRRSIPKLNGAVCVDSTVGAHVMRNVGIARSGTFDVYIVHHKRRNTCMTSNIWPHWTGKQKKTHGI